MRKENCYDVQKKCLIDLHLHLDGSISLNSARELAAIEEIELPVGDKDLMQCLTVSKDCRNLNDYLEKFALPCSLLQSKESISKAVYNLCKELMEEGYIYAEIRFAPQLSCKKGLTQEEVVLAAIKGLKESEFHGQLILCCMRSGEDNFTANMETVRLTKKYLTQGVCACDLAGAEGLYPNEKYAQIFEYARNLKLPFTIHSGEAMGADSVKKAIEYGAKRIGHGVRILEDSKTMELVREKRIPLEICPTSNLQTCVFENYEQVPVEVFRKFGIFVTINSDNRTVSGTDVRKELQLLVNTFSYGKEEMQELLMNAAKAAFTSEEVKKSLIKQIMEL